MFGCGFGDLVRFEFGDVVGFFLIWLSSSLVVSVLDGDCWLGFFKVTHITSVLVCLSSLWVVEDLEFLEPLLRG